MQSERPTNRLGRRPGTYGRGAGGETPFVAAISLTGDAKPDQIILRHVAGLSKIAIARLVRTALAPGAHAVSDALCCFPAVMQAGCTTPPVKTGSERKRPKPLLQMGQHRAWQHQGRNRGNLQGRTGQACAAMPRRIRIPVQSQIPARTMIPRLAYVSLRTAHMPSRLLKCRRSCVVSKAFDLSQSLCNAQEILQCTRGLQRSISPEPRGDKGGCLVCD
jgi:hypothetical protein